MLDLKVGQELWYVSRWQFEKKGHSVKVDTVGRKYARLGNGLRVLLTPGSFSLVEYRGCEVATCYPSEAAYQECLTVHAAYRDFKNALPAICPADVTLADIEAVKALLHMGGGK